MENYLLSGRGWRYFPNSVVCERFACCWSEGVGKGLVICIAPTYSAALSGNLLPPANWVLLLLTSEGWKAESTFSQLT
ncbi:hypothetical protein GDO78_010855 [Eleutherodactylus coqui]|uniref:Uncharacterized protein n=1 Tax=Eleutherodactylus coqui TaxID=57060 RepID=A0A8J6F595_ELECQ|nr:hypothetical protein GDO78_010855 [Eleutherodactylus coqui]